MNNIKQVIPGGYWWLGFNTDNNTRKSWINNNNTKVSEIFIQNTNECNNCRGNPPTNNHIHVILDTGPTKNYIKVDTTCENKVKKIQGPRVLLPYIILTKANHREKLNLIPFLSTGSKTAHILPHLQLGALIYIGQICDDVCTSTFTTTHTTVYKNICSTRRKIQRSAWNVACTPSHHTTNKPHTNT